MDPAYLIDLAGGDREVAREILGEFVTSDAEDRRKLAAAAASGDLRNVREVAHAIKGAARSVGADDYAMLAETVEHQATAGTLAQRECDLIEATGIALAGWVATFR